MSTCREETLSAVAALMTRNRGQPVTPTEIVHEVNHQGGTHAEPTVRTHIVAHKCINAATPPQWPDLRRVDRGRYVLATLAARTVPRAVVPAPASLPLAHRVDVRRGWPWEGAVQSAFAGYLISHGWQITSTADTASKARGVDLLAGKGERRLGAEVKGWPSSGYADPRRAEEVKPTPPTNQAGHWFSQALMKGLMLLDTHPGFESLVVVPDYPRYRDLAARIRTGRTAARVHAAFVREDGTAESDTWTP